MARLLVYRPGAIGDGLLAFPALAALRRAFPAAPLTLVANPAILPLARDAGLADETCSPDDARLTALFAGTHLPPADLPLPTHAVLWSGAAADPLATTLRAAGTTVLHAPGQPPPPARQHVADYLVSTLAPFGLTFSTPAVPHVVPNTERLEAARAWLEMAAQTGHVEGPARPPRASLTLGAPPQFWGGGRGRALALPPSASIPREPGAGGDLATPPIRGGCGARERDAGGPCPVTPGAAETSTIALAASAPSLRPAGTPAIAPYFALHLGSGSPRKNWPLAGWLAVARALAATGLRPLVVGGPAEAALVDQALDDLAPLQPAAARDWPLDALAALLASCALYLGADSGVTHLAAAVGVPTVALFGPTDPVRWAPRGPRVAVVQHPVPCQPCTWQAMWACPHRACLTALTPDPVLLAASQLLEAHQAAANETSESPLS